MTSEHHKHESKPLMPTNQQDKQPTDQEKRSRQQLHTLIGQNVMLTLGPPGTLERVQVRPLWDAHYRVNVFVGADAASARVAHSYFLVADGNGNIVSSTPQITKQY